MNTSTKAFRSFRWPADWWEQCYSTYNNLIFTDRKNSWPDVLFFHFVFYFLHSFFFLIFLRKNRNGKNMKIIDLNRMLEHISYKHWLKQLNLSEQKNRTSNITPHPHNGIKWTESSNSTLEDWHWTRISTSYS